MSKTDRLAVGHRAVDGDDHARMRAVGDHGFKCRGIHAVFAIKGRSGVGRQRPPALNGAFPVGAAWRARPVGEKAEGGLIRRNHAGACAGFDGHVAHGHALFHVQGADRFTTILQHMSGAALDADLADDGQHQVLGGDARMQFLVDVDGEGLRLALQDALGGEHVSDLGGTDTEGQGAECTMGAGVTVAADNGAAGTREAQLRADDVHDPAQLAVHVQQFDAGLGAIALQLLNLAGGRRGGHRNATKHLFGARRRGVIHGGQGPIPAAHGQLLPAQHIECLRRGDFMDEVQVDEEHRRGVGGLRRHFMLFPNLLKHRLRHI